MATATLPEPSLAQKKFPPPESVPASSFGPIKKTDRLVNIDFVRGVALLGILLFNVASFFAPVSSFMGATQLPLADQIAVLFVTVLVAGKFISTFSMLFGYGLLGQVERAAAAGQSPGGFAARRLGVLAVFGLMHALWLWYGDVLFLYASLGIFVVLWRGNSAGSLLIIAGVLLSLAALVLASGGVIDALFTNRQSHVSAEATAEPLRGLEAMIAAGGNITSPMWQNAETIANREGPWSDALAFRLVNWVLMVSATFLVGWFHIVGMFALGAWMWRRRFFDPDQVELRRRIFRIFLPVGLALALVAAALYGTGLWADSRAACAVGGIIGALAVVILPLGYVSGLSLLAEKLPSWLSSTVASAGKMALTVYLSQTVIATFLSYYWGLGWFGRVSPWQQLGLAIAIWFTLIIASRLWLCYFSQGPMEWLWRRLEYGRTR